MANLAYEDVRSWNDLIDTNLAFLEGRRSDSFYNKYYNNDINQLEEDLIRLQKEFGVFTYDFQASYVDRYNIRKRGFLYFLCEKNHNLVDRLLADQRLYMFVREENLDGTASILHNCPHKIPLSDPEGVSFILEDCEERESDLMIMAEDFPNIHNLLSDAFHVFIAMKELPRRGDFLIDATTCLLDALEGKN